MQEEEKKTVDIDTSGPGAEIELPEEKTEETVEQSTEDTTNETQDLKPLIPVLKEVLGSAIGKDVASFNFKEITNKFSELMFDYPFRVPARFALIIRAVISQEGLALRLDPDFKIVSGLILA